MPWFAILLAVLLAACSPRAGFLGNPVSRSISWFSTVGGDDIRAACRAGTPDRARLVYNGAWDVQTRVYELRAGAPGDGARLGSFVFAEPDLQFVVFDDLSIGGPWSGNFASTRLSPGATGQIWAALRADGLGAPPPSGLDLPSWGSWWAVSACLDGRFVFNAWAHPSSRFAALAFPALLFSQDPVPIAVLSPGTGRQPVLAGRDGGSSGYTLRVGREGLVGTLGL